MTNDDQGRERLYAQSLHTGELSPVSPAPAGSPEPVPDAEPRRKRRWVGFVMATAFIGTVLGVLIVLGLKFADGPAVGDVLKADVTPGPSAGATPAETMQLLEGTYFSLKYPSVFDTVSHKPDGPIFLDQYNLSAQKDYRRLLTISVHKFEYDLKGDSDVASRILHNYKLTENKAVAGDTVYTMTNPAGGETSVFWDHKGLVLEVSATSSTSNDDVAGYIAKILPTIRWRQ